mgnify:CR=1 FL=1
MRKRSAITNATRKSLKLEGRSAKVFQEVVETCDLLLTFGYRPTAILKYGMDGVRKMKTARERAYHRQELLRLQSQKLLSIRKIGNEYRVALTERGSKEMFRLQVLQAPPMPDGCVCMVAFDIPEIENALRRSLRNFLRYAGFVPIQKSVWISPYDAWEPLVKLFDLNRTSRWISVFVSRRMDLRK